ncbi:MAG TPA: DUF2231 domain-containing protein [Sphingomicrobium sp.]|jgi:uncharacterized membrane protein|nr:DUF2231 domain-containing protein [Sphingomicrobium sp.]
MAEARKFNPVASVTGPIYLLLFPIPIALFLAALITDVVYSSNSVIMWAHFSSWLIAAGLVLGLLPVIASLVELIASHALRSTVLGWGHIFLFWATMIIELFNMLIHTRDGWTSVVPTGLILSIIACIVGLAAVATLFFVPLSWTSRREAHS